MPKKNDKMKTNISKGVKKKHDQNTGSTRLDMNF